MTEIVATERSSRDYVNALARGLEVIRVFTRHQPRMTLSEVARATDMTRATVRRFLLTLAQEGYVGSDGKYYRLTPKVLDLGFSVLSSMDIWESGQPIMNELAEKLEESCFAAVLDVDTVIYVLRASSRRVVNVGITIGSRVPAHCVSTGRVLLSGLSDDALDEYLGRAKLVKYTPTTVTSKSKLRRLVVETRRQGFAIVDQELEVGLRSISVPVRDRAGAIVAALNVCCPSPRVAPEEMRGRILAELLASAQRISLALER
jgi:IclR family transcriptional regulator, pca regulon regulatory protein